MTPQPPIYVDFDAQPIYEIGATLVTILTMSEPRDTDNDRGRVQMSLCKWGLTTRTADALDWAAVPTAIRPLHAAWPETNVQRDLTILNRRMPHRMNAARVVMPFLKQAQTGSVPSLVPPVRRLTINKMIERVLPASSERDLGNFKTRVWRPSRTVLHLAAAVEMTRELLAQNTQTVLDYTHLLWNRNIVRTILAHAEHYEALLAMSNTNQQLRADPGILVRIRVAGKTGSRK